MSVCQADNSEEEEDVIGVVPDSAVDNVDNVSCSFIMTGALRAFRNFHVGVRTFLQEKAVGQALW